MSIALYRKYRPQSFSEVVSQEHVKTTLLNSISLAEIGHAYIFVGARGIGKTTLARLFAKAVNCQKKDRPEPCNSCDSCKTISDGKALDLIEIDAASNRGIEEIRELREKVKFSPSQLKYKIFIIDEVHMLTKEAFNALLKTLEEPPEHAIFLLATTEAHKIPATILSRCQRFDLKRLTVPELVSYLDHISKKEGFETSPESLELIAQQSDGCARDSVSLLTQLTAYAKGKVDQKLVKDVLGVTDQSIVAKFVDIIIAKNSGQGIDELRKLVEGGYDLNQFTKNLIEYFRKILLINVGASSDDVVLVSLSSEQLEKLQEQSKVLSVNEVVKFIKIFLEAQPNLGKSVYPQLPLELALFELFGDIEAQVEAPPVIQDKPAEPIQKPKALPKKVVLPEPVKPITSTLKPSNLKLSDIEAKWAEVLEAVMPLNHSVAAFLRAGVLQSFSENYLTIAFKFRFHKERFADRKHRLIVEEVIEKVYGEKILIRPEVDDSLIADTPVAEKQEVANVEEAPKNVADMAKDVFGGKLI